jgi:hypothetical protein
MVPSIQKSRLANAQTQANHIHPSQVSSNRKSGAEHRPQGAMILVEPASHRLLALFWKSNTAGPSCVRTSMMPALRQNAAASIRHNFQPFGHQYEKVCSFKLRHYTPKRSDF